jgi:hypothetical protein
MKQKHNITFSHIIEQAGEEQMRNMKKQGDYATVSQTRQTI